VIGLGIYGKLLIYQSGYTLYKTEIIKKRLGETRADREATTRRPSTVNIEDGSWRLARAPLKRPTEQPVSHNADGFGSQSSSVEKIGGGGLLQSPVALHLFPVMSIIAY